MADNRSDELTTEQILSSIRDILLDGDKKAQPKKEVEKEDVLELTLAMVVSKPKLETFVEEICEPKPTVKVDPKLETNPENIVVSSKVNFNSEEVACGIIRNFSEKFTNLKSNSSLSNIQSVNEDEILKSSISQAVEDWVFKNIKSDFQLQKTVKEEVAKQVNVWFNANFVNLVNLSIKQELERVMAKVDSVQ